MKLKLVILLVISLMGQTVFAKQMKSCYADYYEMHAQIETYGSITSRDHIQFQDVQNPRSINNRECVADGYSGRSYYCQLQWEAGNWGDTFHCAR